MSRKSGITGVRVLSPERLSIVPSLLICDDAVAFPVLFRRWMRDVGLDEVSQVKTAAETVAKAEQTQPDVIVVDHMLPDATSEDLVPRLRDVAPDSRILLISGMPAHDLAELAEAAGVDAHLPKAATAQDMQEAVLGLLPSSTR
jgi:CheY-like chemotaxis protein